jgi:tetratricopeptide (TPR) repeat protein
MPRQDAPRVTHTTFINHRIIAREGETYPDSVFQQTKRELPELIHVSAIPGSEEAPVPPAILVQTYRQILLRDSDPILEKHYSALLDQLAATEQSDIAVLSVLALDAARKGTAEGKTRAITYLKRAIELGSTAADDYLLFAELLSRSGRVGEAIDVLERAIPLDPYDSLYYESLAVRYMTIGRYKDALAVINQGLQLFPGSLSLRTLSNKAKPPALVLRDIR